METNKTFTIIKPDAFKKKYSGAIIKQIEDSGFQITNMKLISLTKELAEKFYSIHKEKPFFTNLCEYMCSGPIIVMSLKKDNAVEDFRKLIGSTDPEKAEEGTIRKLYATSIEANAIHGSDSDDNAKIESDFFFQELKLNQKLFNPCPIDTNTLEFCIKSNIAKKLYITKIFKGFFSIKSEKAILFFNLIKFKIYFFCFSIVYGYCIIL